MGKKFIFLAVLAVFAAGMFFMLYRQNQEVMRKLYMQDGEILEWSESSPNEIRKFVEPLLRQAIDALSADNYATSREIYRKSVQPTASVHLGRFGDRYMVEGLTVREWYGGLDNQYLTAVDSALVALMERLRAGDTGAESADLFLAAFGDIPAVRDRYLVALEEARGVREGKAAGWFRVILEGAEEWPELRGLVRRELRGRAEGAPGTTLAFGRPLSEKEAAATPSSLTAAIHVDYATYKIGKVSVFGQPDWSPPPIPGFVHIRFVLDRFDAPVSTWDRLPDIRALVDPPTLITRKTEEFVMEQHTTKIFDLLAGKFEAVPPFDWIRKPIPSGTK